MSEAAPEEEEGYIRCLCGSEEDDGFTICCDKCLAWQHALCVNIEPANVPDTYLCELCDTDLESRATVFNVDPDWAVERQALRRTAEIELRAREDLNEGELLAHARAVAYGHVSLASLKEEPKRKKRKSLTTVETRASRNQPSLPSGYTLDGYPLMPMLEEDDAEFQGWQYEYTPSEHLHWIDEAAAEQVRSALQAWFSRQHVASSNDETETLEEAPKIKYSVSVQRSKTGHVKWTRKRLKAHARNHAPADEFLNYDPEEDVGIIAPVGVVEIPNLPEVLPRTAIKPVHPASMSLAPPLSMPFSTGSAAPSLGCPYPRPTSQALFAQSSIPAGAFICTITGQIVSVEGYRSNPINQYKTIGIPKPNVKGVPGPWSCYIDARQFGSEARFARSGCHPNAVIRPVVFKAKATSARSTTETFEVAFALFALTDIAKREEIVLPWDWDDAHIVHTLPSLLELPSTQWVLEPSPDLSRRMAAVSATLFGLTVCACEKRKDCALGWLWKLACSSQPSGAGGGTKREVDSDEVIKERMMASLGTNAAQKKGARGKKPELGPLMELHRGWLNRGPEPEEQAVEAHKLAEAVKQPPTPVQTQNETATLAMQMDEPEQQSIKIFEDEHPALPISEPAAMDVDAPTSTTEQPVHKDGVLHDQPPHSEPFSVQVPILGEPDLLAREVINVSSPEAVREPTPEPIKEPTPPPPPPPRAKLSFAAYRKRKLEKGPETESLPPVLTEEPAAMEEATVKSEPRTDLPSSPSVSVIQLNTTRSLAAAAQGLANRSTGSAQDTPPYSPKESRSSSEAPEARDSLVDAKSNFQRSTSTYVRPTLDAFYRSPAIARRTSPSPDRSPPQQPGFFPPARQQYSTLSSYASAASSAYFPSTMSMQYGKQVSLAYRSPSPALPGQRDPSVSPLRSPSPRPRSASPPLHRNSSPEPPPRLVVQAPNIPTGPRGIYNRYPGRGGANVRGRGLNLMPYQAQSQDSGYANMARRPNMSSFPNDDFSANYSPRDAEPPRGPKAYSRPVWPSRDGPPPGGPRRPLTPPRGMPTGPAADRYRREYSPDYRPIPVDGPPIPRGPARAMTRGYRGGYRGGRGRG